MANYSASDIQAAVDAGLISEQDAQQLMAGMEGGGIPYGQIAGGVAGAALGGVAGAKLGSKAGMGLASKFGGGEGKLASLANSMGVSGAKAIPGMAEHTLGAMGGGAAGAGMGAYGGQMAGGAVDSEGVGDYDPQGEPMEQAQGGLSEDDRTMALQALMDPKTPPQVKKEILQILQQYDAQEQGTEDMGAEGGQDQNGVPWGALAGGAAGGALAGYGGAKMASRFMPDVGASMGSRMINSPAGKMGGTAMGAGGGAMLGDFAQAAMNRKPYEDPLAGQGQ